MRLAATLRAHLAHHLSAGEDGQPTLMVASIRYLDEFVKQDGCAVRRCLFEWR